MVRLLFFSSFVVALLQAILSLVNILKSQRTIERGIPAQAEGELPRVLIVLPVLREERVIEATLDHFFTLDYPPEKYTVVVVTTEKEREHDHRPNTIDVISGLKSKYPLLKTLHYPYRDGLKADQLNYVAEHFERIAKGDPLETFYAFYDADSRPEKDILRKFGAVLSEHKHANVFQQSASYLKNYGDLGTKGFWEGNFLRAQALKQTRFILAHEIPRIQRVFRATMGASRCFLDKATYAPTIGHGLFVRASYLDTMRFPKGYTPEDMFWGFLVTSMNEPIVFIPSLDRSETPDSIRKLFFQLASWFKGPLLSFKYQRFLRAKYPQVFRQHRTRVLAMCLFALADAAYWLGTSFFVWQCILACILWDWMIVLFAAFILVHLAGSICVVDRSLECDLTLGQKLVISAFSILVLLVYSIPPIFTLVQLARGKTVFHKTER